MKKIIGLFLALGICTVIASTKVVWDRYIKRQPPIPMPAAYLEATRWLGVATNEFFCVSASLYAGGGRPEMTEVGEWDFTFCNTNGDQRVLSVFMGKNHKPQTLEGGIEFP